jgi:H+/Cl- antiporter ClcA
MGIIGALLPLTLFSGEEQTLDLLKHAAELGVLMLILLAISKLLATTLLLSTGWKGGYVFPIMFAGIALGLACDLLLPGIPPAVTVASVLAGALVASLRAPLFSALFTLVFVDATLAAVVAVAVLVSALLVSYMALRQARKAEAQTKPDEAMEGE